MTRGRRLALMALAVGLVVGAAAYLLLIQRAAVAPLANPEDGQQVARGAGVYVQRCASCHGAALEGEPEWRSRKLNGRLPAPPHDESGHTWHHPDQDLFRIIKFGLRPPLAPVGYESDMPAFAGVLSDAEIWAALAFIKSTWSSEIRDRQRMVTEQSIRR